MESPKPKSKEFLTPSSFLATIKLLKSLAVIETKVIIKIISGAAKI
jgi:hypothetical protein